MAEFEWHHNQPTAARPSSTMMRLPSTVSAQAGKAKVMNVRIAARIIAWGAPIDAV